MPGRQVERLGAERRGLGSAGRREGNGCCVARLLGAEIDAVFATIARQKAGALLVNPDAFFATRRDQFVSLAARYGIPASYFNRQFTEAGGLMSYADDRVESNRQAAIYVGRILK